MKSKIVLAAFFIAVGVIGVSNNSVHAASGGCYFTTTNSYVAGTGTCSVSGNGAYGTNDVLTGRDTLGGGFAIPLEVDTKSEFISSILGKIYSSNTHERIGASFIIQSMNGKTTWPTSADITQWTKFMNNANVTVSSVYLSSISNTSWYDPAKRNTFFGTYSPTVSRQVIRVSYSGTRLAEIEHNCGNMLGGVVPFWMAWPTASVKSQAVVGETVTWTYAVQISGTAATTRSISYGYTNISTSLGSRVTVGSIANGSVVGTIVTFNKSYLVKSTDVGKTYCSQAWATPRASTALSSRINSASACVKIVSSISPVSGCRPIVIKATPVHYDEVSYNAHGYSRYTAAQTVPIRVKIDNTTIGTYSSETLIDDSHISEYYTDGKYHRVTFEETYSHVTSYSSNHHHNSSTVNGVTVEGPPIWDPPTAHETQKKWYDAFQCYDYKLTTNEVSPSNDKPEAGTIMGLNVPTLESESFTNGSVGGLDLHSKTKPSVWQVSEIIIQPGQSNPSSVTGGIVSGSSYDDPCEYYTSKIGVSATCGAAAAITSISGTNVVLRDDAGEFSKTGSVISGTNPYNRNIVVGDYDPGTIVCYAFSIFSTSSEPKNGVYNINTSNVDPASVDTEGGSWNYSDMDSSNSCYEVVKKPKVQVLGGDLITGRSFDPSTSTINSKVVTTTSVKKLEGVNSIRVFGSWSEYGILAFGQISGMASSSAFNGYLGDSGIGMYLTNSITTSNSVSGVTCRFSMLSFANQNCPSSLGSYQYDKSIPDVASRFPVTTSSHVFNTGSLSGLDSGSNGVYSATGIKTITGGNITGSTSNQDGQWVVINSTGTIRITGDITYSNGTYTRIRQVPQAIIIADNITISSGVSRIDAWLIARNSINTCSEVGNSSAITASDCSNPLTINGPLMTNHLYLRRTAGSGFQRNSNDPAEKINLRPDAFLWAYVNTTKKGLVQTTYSTEVPPRY